MRLNGSINGTAIPIIKPSNVLISAIQLDDMCSSPINFTSAYVSVRLLGEKKVVK